LLLLVQEQRRLNRWLLDTRCCKSCIAAAAATVLLLSLWLYRLALQTIEALSKSCMQICQAMALQQQGHQSKHFIFVLQ
jgi:hypothetical protein